MALDGDRRAALERARALTLLRDHFAVDVDTAEITTAPFGVAVQHGDRAWVVSMSDDLAALGGVLVWLDRRAPVEADLVFDHNAGVHARRAEVLAPECRVWAVDDTRVERAEPAAIPPPLRRPDGVSHLEAILIDAGLEVVCEDGIVRGELAGLEVARIVEGGQGPVLEAGVGRFDREAGALLHAGRTSAEAVAEVVAQVRPHRTRGALSHAINRLARERWLRSELVSGSGGIRVSLPTLAEPIPPRRNLLEVSPACLLGDDEGRRVLFACSVGMDLGLVPALADQVRVHAPDELRLVVPPRDRLALLERLVSRLGIPATVLSTDPPWVE